MRLMHVEADISIVRNVRQVKASMKEDKTRDLYNLLRTGEHGVTLEALAQSLYFLQHAEFTLFDVKDAFCSSTGASERFLPYREFQVALSKISRAKCYGNCDGIDGCVSPKQRRWPTASELVGSLVDQMMAECQHCRLDTLQCQMTRSSALDTLEHNLPLLVQSFQCYGVHNRLSTNGAGLVLSTMTLDGFIDFLNAHFEYEEFFSFDDLARMSSEVLAGFARTSAKIKSTNSRGMLTETGKVLNFAQFLELFCRVASAFHHKLLLRECAQLRRTVESCRLEFSIEVLLNHMHISLKLNEAIQPEAATNQYRQEPPGIAAVVRELAAKSSESSRGNELQAMTSAVQNICEMLELDVADHAGPRKSKCRSKGKGSLMAADQVSRRPSSIVDEQVPTSERMPSVNSTAIQHSKGEETRKPPPQVAMIREIAMPPLLPADVTQLLENALKFQNMAQYNMALSELDSCKQRYLEQYVPPSDDSTIGLADPIHTEVQLFFTLQEASVYDSAHKDSQALTRYYKAMKLARLLPVSHPGRSLVKSCVGVTLFYTGELLLAQQCHQQVLDARNATKSHNIKVDANYQLDNGMSLETGDHVDCALIDAATAMNNLACCFSQDQSASTSKMMDNAYLLFKHARQIYADTFGPAHPRVELISRNLKRIRACQNGVVSDAVDALARGEYAYVIPGSKFQIQAFEFVAKPSKKSGRYVSKKKKKKKSVN